MGKIVGNILLIMLVVNSMGAALSLRVLDTDHSPLVQAGAGRPFLIEVAMDNVATIGQPPQVKGLEQFIAKNSGVHITTINGKVTAKYTFEVRIDTPGTYTIGPAIITEQGNQESSQTVRVVVGHQQVEAKIDENKKEEAPVLLRLSANRDHAVVGERVHCQLRFYYTQPTIALQRFIEHEMSDIHRKKMKGPRSGTEVVNGIEYQYAEWEYDIFPQKKGHFTIPAYGADYEQETEERDNFWGGLGRFLGTHIVTKRVYSNALSLDVDALPESEKEVQAVGTFSSMKIAAKPAVAKQGEGIVVTIEITGDTDPDAITFSTLENMPPSLRFYESNQTVVEPTHEGELFKKSYEFIVQGLKIGSWEIPPQSLYYFDTKRKKFAVLKTVPLPLTIMPASKKIIKIEDDHDERAPVKEQQDIAPLHKEWSLTTTPVWYLPWWIFILIILIPMSWLLYQLIVRMLARKQQGSYQQQRAKKAFITAKKQLELLKQHKNTAALYALFVELFVDRWQLSIATLSADEITARLEKNNLPSELLVRWQEFFSTITERAFGVQKGKDEKYLFEKAEQWIEQLEHYL